jgi:predicted MFS family arabinose efflux permease
VAAAGRKPLVPPALWRDLAFRTGVVLYVVFFMALVPFFLYYSYVLQSGAGLGPLDTGLALVPYAIAAAITSTLSRNLIMRWGVPRVAMSGAMICAAGTAAMLLPVLDASRSHLAVAMLGPMVVTGAGLGLVIAPLLFVVLAGIRSAEAGAAAGLLGTAQQVGGALGVALLGILFLQGRSTETIASISYGDLTDGFAAALAAICVVYLAAAALIASLARVQAALASG